MGILDVPTRFPEQPPESAVRDRKLGTLYDRFARENGNFVSEIRKLQSDAQKVLRMLQEIRDNLNKHLEDGDQQDARALANAFDQVERYQRFVKSLT